MMMRKSGKNWTDKENASQIIGTIHQYSWKRFDNIASFNQIGRESLRYLEQTMPFCLEYEEEAEKENRLCVNGKDTSNKIALVDREKQQGKESETTKDSLLNDSGEAPNETDKNGGKKK